MKKKCRQKKDSSTSWTSLHALSWSHHSSFTWPWVMTGHDHPLVSVKLAAAAFDQVDWSPRPPMSHIDIRGTSHNGHSGDDHVHHQLRDHVRPLIPREEGLRLG